ncbi:hypothetical protein [Arenibaculum pallidiluteum]|uniref:hypothetical protein n=1 Tax=Arenibaculum pallidiluteum TaxID=2812559 RepID=UPI001A972063|nr:hypothetical protein [Arenibaculum pallidiluteum]
MGTRDRQENQTGPESIERHFDRISIDHPLETDQGTPGGTDQGADLDRGVTTPVSVGRSGAGMGVSQGDYTDLPPGDPADQPADQPDDRPDTGKGAES